MKTSLDPARVDPVLDALATANQAFARHWPGEPAARQPVHTVYGGAHLFSAGTPRRLGELALAHLRRYAPDPFAFARALGLPGAAELPTGAAARAHLAALDTDPGAHRVAHPAEWLAHTVYRRTMAKLEREPVEDFRIDFEDGYGNRPDREEDQTAITAADEVARALADGGLPFGIGIRVKPMTDELKRRAVRTTDLFVTRLLERAGKLPDRFVITLPKPQIPEQVAAYCDVLDAFEASAGLPPGTLKIELMIEVTQALLDADGRSNLPLLLRAARGRCVGAHFGTYDFTASANVTAQYQSMDHPVCDVAKHLMTIAYASTGLFLSDGATNVMPVGPHKGDVQHVADENENAAVVHAAWRLQYGHVRHSLRGGFYQGWDLHPGQLPVRYAACYTFFLEGFDAASARLRNFVDKAARATLVGDVFDDAATGQGLLNYFLRALNCGAIELADVEATGLTRDEVQGRSFVKILANRRKL
ncbi:MAG: phosphoenolpyruvate kinase, partial [Myxococcota bacterium]